MTRHLLIQGPPTGRRWFGLIGHAGITGLLAIALVGCEFAEEADDDVEDLTIVVEADKSRILEEEAALFQERQAVDTERDRLARERSNIQRKLASLSKKDRKAREKLVAEEKRIDGEEKRMRERAKKFESERNKLDKAKTELIERISMMTQRGSGGLTIEQREARIASREKDLARREDALAKREAKLAGREAQANQTLQGLATVLAGLKGGGVTRTIIVNSGAGSGGGTATRSQAQKTQRSVRQRMDSKGILMDDLPPTAKNLFKQGGAALGGKEYGDAVAAFDQVMAIVDGITINQSFVQGKMARLNRVLTAKQIDDKRKKKVQGLLAEVSDAAADGRYDRANKKANQIALVLKGI